MDMVTDRFGKLICECHWTLTDLIKYGVRTEYLIIYEYEIYEDGDSCGVFFEGKLKDFRREYLDKNLDLDVYNVSYATETMYKGNLYTQIDIMKKKEN